MKFQGKDVIFSTYTLMLYEQEFGGADLIQDLYKKVVVREDTKEEGVICELDFRSVNWTALSRTLWAGLKTANDDVPSYKEWAKSIKEVNMLELNNEIIPLVERAFFRASDRTTD